MIDREEEEEQNHHQFDDEEYNHHHDLVSSTTIPLEYTVNDAIECYGVGMFQILLWVLGALIWLCDGIEILLISYVLPTLQQEWNLSGLKKACIVSVLFMGMYFGSIVFGFIADRFGRKRSLILNLLVTCIPSLLSAFAPNWIVFMVARILTGFGVGGIQIGYSLVSEFIPTKKRAAMLLAMTTTGTLLGSVLTTGLVWILLPHETLSIGPVTLKSWRWLLMFLACPLFVATALSPLIPESPRYQMVRGEQQKALKTLSQIAYLNRVTPLKGILVLKKSDDNHELVESASTPVDENVHKEEDIKPISLAQKIQNLFRESTAKLSLIFQKKYRLISLLLGFLWFISSFAFIGTQVVAAEYLIGGTGSASKYVRTFVPALAEIPVVIIHIFVINWIGRRKTMAIMYAFGTIFLFAMLIPMPELASRIIIVLARISVQTAFQGVNLATPEYFPTEVRATGVGYASSLSRVAGICTPFVSSVMFEASKAATLSVYAVFSLSGIIAVFFLPYDTAGRKLTETVDQEH
jgi:MFS family permease